MDPGVANAVSMMAKAMLAVREATEEEPARGDDCLDCGRHVPLHRIVITERPDGPA